MKALLKILVMGMVVCMISLQPACIVVDRDHPHHHWHHYHEHPEVIIHS